MLQKDRYSYAFLFLIIGFVLAIYLLRQEKEHLASISLLVCLSPVAYLFTRSAKIHIPEEQKDKLNAEYKGEKDCGFDKKFKTEIDGIKIDNQRYKFVNGTDICINNSNIKPCGIGSAIMQFIGDGGKEPKSIQNDTCWT